MISISFYCFDVKVNEYNTDFDDEFELGPKLFSFEIKHLKFDFSQVHFIIQKSQIIQF
jgi:hypothetical protein